MVLRILARQISDQILNTRLQVSVEFAVSLSRFAEYEVRLFVELALFMAKFNSVTRTAAKLNWGLGCGTVWSWMAQEH